MIIIDFCSPGSSVKNGTYEADGWPNDAAMMCAALAKSLLTFAMQADFNKTPERNIAINAVSNIWNNVVS